MYPYLMEQALQGDAQEVPRGQTGVCSTALGARILPRRIHDHTIEAFLRAPCTEGKACRGMPSPCQGGHKKCDSGVSKVGRHTEKTHVELIQC